LIAIERKSQGSTDWNLSEKNCLVEEDNNFLLQRWRCYALCEENHYFTASRIVQ